MESGLVESTVDFELADLKHACVRLAHLNVIKNPVMLSRKDIRRRYLLLTGGKQQQPRTSFVISSY